VDELPDTDEHGLDFLIEYCLITLPKDRNQAGVRVASLPSLCHGRLPLAPRVAREREYPQPHNRLGPSFILSTTPSSQK
jgi:hypothetical protein